MKGMQKIKRGKGFRGVLDYAFENDNGDLDGELIGGNMSGTDPRELAAEFGLSRAMRGDIEKPVWHNSLRLPAGEKLSKEQWCKIGDDYMSRMGFSEAHQRVYVLHDDEKGQHIHAIASRIGLDGQIYLGQNENPISTKIIQRLEKAYGLQITKGPEYDNGKLKQPELKNFSGGEKGKHVRTGEQPLRYQLAAQIDLALQGGATSLQFVERLQAAGIGVKPNFSKNTLNGFSFVIEGTPFKGSQLGDGYKGASLFKKGMTYDHAREYETLRSLTATATADSIHPAIARDDSKPELEQAGERVDRHNGGDQEPIIRSAGPDEIGIDGNGEGNGGKLRGDHRAGDLAIEPGAVDVDQRGENGGQQTARDSGPGGGGSAEVAGAEQQPGVAASAPGAKGVPHGKGSVGNGQSTGPQPGHERINLSSIDVESGAAIKTGDKIADELAQKAQNQLIQQVKEKLLIDKKFWLQMHDSLRKAEALRRKSNKPRGRSRGLLLDLAAPQLRLASGDHEQTVRRLLQALGVDRYDLRLIEPGAGQVGKVRRAVTAEALQKPEQINLLRRESALGRELHIRPSKPEKSGLLLLSDLRKEQLNELTAIGLKPAVITELPGQSLQAWIRINKGGFDGIERDALSAFIEQQVGVRVDESYGRLPGFGGVQLLNADGGTTPSGQHMLQSIRDRLREDNTRALQEALSAEPRTVQVDPEPLARKKTASGLPSSNKAFALVAAEKAALAMAELEARLDREDDFKPGE